MTRVNEYRQASKELSMRKPSDMRESRSRLAQSKPRTTSWDASGETRQWIRDEDGSLVGTRVVVSRPALELCSARKKELKTTIRGNGENVNLGLTWAQRSLRRRGTFKGVAG
ncbi:hypothetical protein DFH09DRAFT_1071515 [Mycena vulgaris]|nr:hypothetical protein DFH09DRAFT_1071515 [Mycena vulgaris]